MQKKMLAVLLASLCAGNVWAQDQTIKVAPQAMPAALHSLASQTGIQLLFSAEELKGIQAKALSGAMSAEDALARLLAGSGYTFQASGKGTYVIKAAPPPPPQKKATAEEVQQLAEVVISATRTPNLLAKVPASVSLVTQDDFEEAQAATVSQAMKKLPNVEFGGGPRASGEIPTIRGYSGKDITIMVDGARQNWLNNTLRSPLYLDPYFVERAEVLRGSASSLYGPGGNGGAMMFRTIAASDFLAPGKDFGASVKAGHTSADNGQHYNARAYASNGAFDGLVAAGHHEWGSTLRQGGGTQLDPNDGEATSGLMKLGLNAGGWRYELSHQEFSRDNRENSNPQADSALPGAAAVQMFHTRQNQTVLKAATTGKADEPAIAASLYDVDLNITADRGTNPALAPYTKMRTETRGGSVQGSLPLGSGTVRQRLTAGIDYFRDEQASLSGSAPNSVIPDGSQDVTGVFVQDEIALNESWSLLPSLRYDRYESNPASTGTAKSDSRVSPKVALSWQAADGLTLYGSYGEAFRAPTVNEMYFYFSGTTGYSNFRQNPNLRPQTDKTFEIGGNYTKRGLFSTDDRFKLRATAFDSRAQDLITNVVVGTYTRTAPMSGVGSIFQYQNVADATRRGLEIEGSYGAGPWALNAGYSQVRVTDDRDGSGLFSPPDKLSLQVRRQLPAGVSAVWQSLGVAAQDYDATALRRRSGYAVHDLFFNWTPSGQKFRIDAGVANLFDKRYLIYQSSNTSAFTYQEGRSVRISLSADF